MTGAAVVMAKAPVPGEVKTRLCPPCDALQAAAIAEAALTQTIEAVAGARVDRRVVVLDGAPGPWLPPGFEVIEQRGTGLGERLANALIDVGGPVVLLGMDTPQITSELVEDSLTALDRWDAAVGPTVDGGYWAIALRVGDPLVFGGVPMSRSDTYAKQVTRLDALGLKTGRLPRLRDVDFFSDALAVASEVPGSKFAAAVQAARAALEAAS